MSGSHSFWKLHHCSPHQKHSLDSQAGRGELSENCEIHTSGSTEQCSKSSCIQYKLTKYFAFRVTKLCFVFWNNTAFKNKYVSCESTGCRNLRFCRLIKGEHWKRKSSRVSDPLKVRSLPEGWLHRLLHSRCAYAPALNRSLFYLWIHPILHKCDKSGQNMGLPSFFLWVAMLAFWFFYIYCI